MTSLPSSPLMLRTGDRQTDPWTAPIDYSQCPPTQLYLASQTNPCLCLRAALWALPATTAPDTGSDLRRAPSPVGLRQILSALIPRPLSAKVLRTAEHVTEVTKSQSQRDPVL